MAAGPGLGALPARGLGNSGYIPDTFDARDKPYVYRGGTAPTVTSVNLWESKREWLSSVYHQYETSSCVANATAAALRYLAHKTIAAATPDEKVDVTAAVLDPSRLFIYYNARALSSEEMAGPLRHWPAAVLDEGSQIRNAMKSINYFGVAPGYSWPFKVQNGQPARAGGSISWAVGVNDRPRDEAYIEAAKTHAVEYCRLDVNNDQVIDSSMSLLEKQCIGGLTLGRLRHCLAEGFPVVFGFAFYCDIEKVCGFDTLAPNETYYTLKDIPEERRHLGPAANYGRHAVLAVGFEDSKEPGDRWLEPKGRVLVQNSWGSELLPHFWIPYRYILDWEATTDFWMIRLVSPTNPAPPANRPVPSPAASEPPLPEGWSVCKPFNDNKSDVALNRMATMTGVTHDWFDGHFWWINSKGGIEAAQDWVNNQNVRAWWRYPAAAAGGTASAGAITGVVRGGYSIDILWIGLKGSVECFSTNSGWLDRGPRYTLAPEGSATIGGGIVALSMKKDHAAVWWIAPNGSIQGANRVNTEPEGSWARYELAPPGSATPQSSLAACSLDESHMEVFWVKQGQSGCSVSRKRFLSDINPKDPWGPVETVAFETIAARESRLACAARKGTKMVDLWAISPAGAVAHFSWGRSWNVSQVLGHWPAGISGARVDSDIKAICAEDNVSTVFWIGSDNSLMSATNEANIPAVKVLGSGKVMAGSSLGLFSRTKKTITLCYRSCNNELIVLERTG